MMAEGEEPEPPPQTAVSRISRLMALAIHMQELLDRGEVADYAELARLAHVSRPRITQIMNLTLLAPDIQEALLFLPPTDGGHGDVSERQVQRMCGVAGWRRQRRLWQPIARCVVSECGAASRLRCCRIVVAFACGVEGITACVWPGRQRGFSPALRDRHSPVTL